MDWIPGAEVIQSGKKVLDGLSGPTILKFGVGSPAIEHQQCELVQVFFQCWSVGGISNDRGRLLLKGKTSVDEARRAYMDEFNATMNQDKVTDENYFKLGSNDLRRPLTDFSNGCKLNLSYVYSDRYLKPFKRSDAAMK